MQHQLFLQEIADKGLSGHELGITTFILRIGQRLLPP